MQTIDFAFIKPFPIIPQGIVERFRKMRLFKKHEEYEEPHKHEHFLTFLCFLVTALIGYFLTTYVASL